LRGIVSRTDIQSALLAGGSPEVRRAVTCYPDQSVREVGDKFIDSPSNILVVVDRKGEAVVGIVTLHDLIRAQASIQS
jgi:CIC family chloride channel protein